MRLLNLGVLPPLRYLLLSGVQDPAWVLLLSCRSDTLIELIIHNFPLPYWPLCFALVSGRSKSDQYACRAEFLPLDNDVFTYEAHTRKNGSGGCSGGLKNVFRFMATYPHHLSHLSAIESGIHAMARAVDGNAILYNSQTATNAKGFIRASVLLRFRLEGFYVTPDTYDHQGPCSMTQLSS